MSIHTDIPVPPLELVNVGDGEYNAVGDLFLPLFVELSGLRPSHRVLDVGCGIGRMARPLTAYLDSNGLYEGFDIVAPSIEWCRANITPRHPQFRFEWANVFNSVYNPGGSIAPSEYRFPYDNHYFDFVLLTSVFTHMLPIDMEHYFAEIARVLKPTGSSFITYFLLNSESERLIAEGKSTLDLKYDFGVYRTTTESNPEHAVAYDEPAVLALYEDYEFEFTPRVHYGSWCGRNDFVSYQDIISARPESGRKARPAISGEIVSIDRIECLPQSERIVAAHFDRPASVGRRETYGFDLAGWVVGRDEPVRELHVVHEGSVVVKVPVGTRRPDVAALFPGALADDRCGFEGFVGLVGVAPEFELCVRAVFADETGCDFGLLAGRQRFPTADFAPMIQPVMVTSIGRTGTTLLMRLLAAHPAIVAHEEYPYETRAAGYWMHALKVLCNPASHMRSSHPDTFHDDPSWVGHHPFHCPPVTTLRGMSQWFGRSYVEEAGTFVQRSIESFYARLAEAMGKPHPAYFAEKWSPTDLPWIAWSAYPQARELILIRDPRDVVCSILAFGKKKGRPSFGRERYASDEEFIGSLRAPLERLLQSWRRRDDVARLVRYEDLIERPVESLSETFAYLELDASAAHEVVARALEPTWALELHRTSRDPASSVGRWRQDLAPGLQEACERSFGDVLVQFGYEPNGPAGARIETPVGAR